MDHEAGVMTLSDDDRRVIGLWVADCAERVLPLFEARAPSDTRPREALEAIRAYAAGEGRTAQLRSLALAALSAARELDDPVATPAARAAGLAASSAYIHALATTDQAKHALGPVAYAALARGLAAGDPGAGDEEVRWAIEHASPAVREIVGRFPARGPGRSRLDTLYYDLDAGLRR